MVAELDPARIKVEVDSKFEKSKAEQTKSIAQDDIKLEVPDATSLLPSGEDFSLGESKPSENITEELEILKDKDEEYRLPIPIITENEHEVGNEDELSTNQRNIKSPNECDPEFGNSKKQDKTVESSDSGALKKIKKNEDKENHAGRGFVSLEAIKKKTSDNLDLDKMF